MAKQKTIPELENVAVRINDERFAMMSRSYETEQEQLKEETT